MPESVSAFEMQAEYFANIPILDKTYRASVHLENEKDEMFWDTMLQECRPGKYNYIYFSKSELGNDSKGCKQCLKYKIIFPVIFYLYRQRFEASISGTRDRQCSFYLANI